MPQTEKEALILVSEHFWTFYHPKIISNTRLHPPQITYGQFLILKV